MGKHALFVCAAIFLAGNLNAQTDAGKLLDLSRSRSAHFKAQKTKVEIFSARTGKPIAFTDEKGNTIHLVGLTETGLPVYFTTLNDDAAITTDVVQLRSGGSVGLNLQGAEMLIGLWDGGRVKDHIELGSRVISKEGTSDDNHATHVTGTLIATGINPAAKGMAPLAQVSAHDFDNDEAEMSALASAATSLLFSNHSYGTITGWYKSGGVWSWSGDPSVNPIEDYRFGFYDERAQTIDQIAWLSPYYNIVWATGNDRADYGSGTKPPDCNGGSGYDCIIPEAVSKNIITVGAVEPVLSYSGPFDVTMSFFSSWGPTDDGRIKPDLVGDGVNLFSLSANGTNTYTTLSGTSMATPNVAGSLSLIEELYKKLHAGNVMKAATVKALAIHTAKEAGNFPGPDYSFGWGLLDAAAASKILLAEDNRGVFVKELTLKQDSIFEMSLQPKANKKITATIVWTDPPGTPLPPSLDPTGLSLVNDLDIRITDDQGREQLPWSLDPTNPTHQAIHADNFRDNVEKLEFDLPEGKDYLLSVQAKHNLSGGKQDFSLILSYEPVNATRSFYWIGDAGNWNDGSHWANSSGGSASFQVPGPYDAVIVDENSFDGIGTDFLSLSSDAYCQSFLWISSQPSGISFNNNALTIGSKCVLASNAFGSPTDGTVHLFNGSGNGQVTMTNNTLTRVNFIFDGSWEMAGDFQARSINLNSGMLEISNSHVRANQLNAATTASKVLQMTDADIRITGSSTMDGTKLVVGADDSSLVVDSTSVTFQWQAVEFPGSVTISPGETLVLNGNNHLSAVTGTGTLEISGSNAIDSLSLGAGSLLELLPGTVQTLSGHTQLSGSVGLPVNVHSSGSATLSFPDHVKKCFDYTTISNVQVAGSGIINAGIHSTLNNATGWRQSLCSDILFADFGVQYPCVNGLTQFTSYSAGPVSAFTWRLQNHTISHDENPSISFTGQGTISILLLVEGGGTSDSVRRDVEIGANNQQPSEVVVAGNILTSSVIAGKYQWFRDGLLIPGETSRSFVPDSDEGVYYVVTYQGSCNIVSDTLTFTGFGKPEDLQVYPNPVTDVLKITFGKEIQRLQLMDVMGRTVWEGIPDSMETIIDARLFSEGMYFVQLTVEGMVERRKVIITH